MVKIGQKVQFEVLKGIKKLNIPGEFCRIATGTVVYINHQNRWFSVEYDCNGSKQRASFKYFQIGQDVMLCGNQKGC